MGALCPLGARISIAWTLSCSFLSGRPCAETLLPGPAVSDVLAGLRVLERVVTLLSALCTFPRDGFCSRRLACLLPCAAGVLCVGGPAGGPVGGPVGGPGWRCARSSPRPLLASAASGVCRSSPDLPCPSHPPVLFLLASGSLARASLGRFWKSSLRVHVHSSGSSPSADTDLGDKEFT